MLDNHGHQKGAKLQNISMAEQELKKLSSCQQQKFDYYRYVDDMLIILTHELDPLNNFFNNINLTLKISTTTINFFYVNIDLN